MHAAVAVLLTCATSAVNAGIVVLSVGILALLLVQKL